MKHTMGPWHIGREADHSADRFKRNCEWAMIRDERGGLIAKIESVHPKGEKQSSDFDIEAGNAALIAAAPDLLEALEAVANSPRGQGLDVPVVIQVMEAIFKAKEVTK